MREFEIANTVFEANVILEEIVRPIDYDLVCSSAKKDPEKASKKIIFASEVIKTTGDSGKAMMQIGSAIRTFSNVTPTESLTQGVSVGSIVFAALDFLLIPFVYLTCYLLNEKVPANRGNNAKWLYSAVSLALTITAITVPAAAVAIAFTSVSISLLLSVFLLGRTIHERYRLGKERRAIRRLIANAEEELLCVQTQAMTLKNALKNVSCEQQLILLCEQIASLQECFKAQKDLLIELKLNELNLNKKIKDMGFVQVMDKGVGLSLSAVGMMGLIVSLYFPMAGLGILTAVSAISLAYLLLRVGIPLVQLLIGWIASKLQPAVGESTPKDDLTPTGEPNKEPSTDSMLEYFFGSKQNANESLQKAPPKDPDLSLTSVTSIFQTEKNSLKKETNKVSLINYSLTS